MRILFLLLFNFFALASSAQEITADDSIARTRAKLLVTKHLKRCVENSNYVLFSISDRYYLIVVEHDSSYVEHFVEMDLNGRITKHDTVKTKPNELLRKMFNPDLYHSGYITFQSEYFKNGYEIASGAMTYFFLRTRKGKTLGESRLSVFVKPNPIDFPIYNHLVNRVIKFNKG
jgi:hypothetical protein